MRHVIFLGLGSNLGDREGFLRTGIEALERNGIEIDGRSSIYETEPVGLDAQPWFLNLVIRGRTDQAPAELLGICKRIERDLGRADSVRFGPRVLDIDVLLYDACTITEEDLEIPHPRMHERRFVLVPLLEVDPNLCDPRTGTAYADILNRLDEGKKVFQSLRNES